VELFHTGRGNTGRTLWDGYNAITEWVDHHRPARDWVEMTQFGSGDALKRQAFSVAVEMLDEPPRVQLPVCGMPWTT
jgi:hypothetical protein